MVGGTQRLLSVLPGCARDVSGAAPDVHTLCASTPQRSAGPPLVLILGGRAPSGARIRMPSTPSRRTRSSHERFPTLVPRLVEELDGRWSAPRRRCAPRLLREVRHGLRLQALRFQGFRLEALLLEGHQPHRPQRIAALAEQEEIGRIRPDLDGNRIMEILDLPPGREVGAAYKHLLELRMEHGPLGQERAEQELRAWWEARSGS